MVDIRININGFVFNISFSNDIINNIKTKEAAQKWALENIYNKLKVKKP